MSTEHSFQDYEVVAVQAKGRVLLTIDRRELPLQGTEQVVRSSIQDHTLVLELDSGHSLRFVDMPELQAANLKKLEPTLCAIENRHVAFAISFPQPTSPRVVSKPR
jgi:hypothetical protein